MARPMKDGVDYFPLDVNVDKKFRFVEAKFGIVGFGVIVKLFQLIYAENGYYCEWDEDTALIMAAENSCQKYPLSIDDVQDIISEAISRGIFDKGMYDTYGILTSKGIQRRYLEMTKRRSRVDVEQRYLLICIPEKTVNVYINGVNVNTNSKNVDNNSQSKVKESKVNKSKVKETIEAPPVAVPQSLIDHYQENISCNFITSIELDNLEFWLTRVDADMIEWAIREAAEHNKRNWKYIEGILRNHFNAGRTTLEQVQDAQRNFKRHDADLGVYKDDNLDYDELEKIMQEKM